LEPRAVDALVVPIVARVKGWRGQARLLEARLIRHKPGRRCVVYYELELGDRIGVYGKMRARGPDLETQTLLEEFRRAGLDPDLGGRAGVPRPMGCLPQWNMTLQQAAPGKLLSARLEASEPERSMEQVAETLFEFHRVGVKPRRTHTIEDELEILRTRLDDAASRAPEWRKRIQAIWQGCTLVADRLPATRPLGIHRDFYPDQVLIDGERTTLLDLDLFALGDPALDVGNFSAHLVEMALREHADARRYAPLEEAFEDRYAVLAPGVSRSSIRTYRLLTLARHIHLSMTLPGRSATTATLLDVCEGELQALDRDRPRS
jgi:hypothetical protein